MLPSLRTPLLLCLYRPIGRFLFLRPIHVADAAQFCADAASLVAANVAFQIFVWQLRDVGHVFLVLIMLTSDRDIESPQAEQSQGHIEVVLIIEHKATLHVGNHHACHRGVRYRLDHHHAVSCILFLEEPTKVLYREPLPQVVHPCLEALVQKSLIHIA